jgi:alkylhydroperoxidase family enzyme
VDNVLKIHSLHPEGLHAHFAVYGAAMKGTATLPKADREMIAVVVSRINDCHY